MSKESSVRYDKPEDWVHWRQIFQDKAEDLGLWKYYDPERTNKWPEEPIEPIEPTYSDTVEPIEGQARTTRSNTSQQESTQRTVYFE